MAPDLNQIQPNTIGFANLPLEARPFPNWSRVNTRDNGGYHNYHDLVPVARRALALGSVAHDELQVGASIDNIEERGAGQSISRARSTAAPTTASIADYLRGPTTNIPDHRFVTT